MQKSARLPCKAGVQWESLPGVFSRKRGAAADVSSKHKAAVLNLLKRQVRIFLVMTSGIKIIRGGYLRPKMGMVLAPGFSLRDKHHSSLAPSGDPFKLGTEW